MPQRGEQTLGNVGKMIPALSGPPYLRSPTGAPVGRVLLVVRVPRVCSPLWGFATLGYILGSRWDPLARAAGPSIKLSKRS